MDRNPNSPAVLFRGVSTSLPVNRRPSGTAAKCTNFRIMPGWTLRLRGGRKARYYLGQTARRIVGYRDPALPGANVHLVQLVSGGGVVTWNIFTTEAGPTQYQPYAVETVSTAYDSAFSATKPAAACLLVDRPLFYNGLGVRDSGTGSKPPFSTYYGGAVRYFGLDAYAPLGAPSVAFAAGAGYNEVASSVSLYVGLYNAGTNHYSNGILMGTLTASGATGTITVSDLQNLKNVYHVGGESADLNYVFYATVDGGQVPYLILNAGLTGPHTAPYNGTTASLSIADDTENGWVLDLTKEMPVRNFPPRPMRSICHVNSRLYGALLMSGSGGDADFTYVPSYKELAGVVWSDAPEDIQRRNSVGDPLQCWSTLNIAHTPSADSPTVVMPAQDSVRVLVITPTSTFLLEDIGNGIHAYITISRIFGIAAAASAVETPYGIVWTTQHNHIVMLRPNALSLIDLSSEYQSLITGTVTAADYLFDPTNRIDRYQIWMDNGTSVIHDFALAGEGNYGEGYDATGYTGVTAAASLLDANGKRHHIIAATGFYTHEAQPEDARILTTDETYTDPVTVAETEIDGEYRSNWTAEGDSDLRKDLEHVDVIGDVELSEYLTGTTPATVCPVSIEWYADFEELAAGNLRTMVGARVPQTVRNYWRFKPRQPHHFWYKFVLKLLGHSADDASYAKYPVVATDGDNALNFYGQVIEARRLYSAPVNRK